MIGLGIDLSLSPKRGGGAAAFTPASLSPTAWYDPSDLATVWQDSARTTPASVNGVVGAIDDKSGNGKHLLQATTAAKPVLRQSGALYWLEFDGVDDFMETAIEPFGTSISEASVMIAHREISRVAGGLITLAEGGLAFPEVWRTLAPFSDGTIYFDVGGGSPPNRITAAAPAVGTDIVFLFESSVINSRQLFTIDGAGGASDATGHTIDATGLTMRLARSSTNYQNTQFSGAVIKTGSVLTTPQRASLLTWLAAKQGRVL